jgi:hypothetical protein
MTNVITLASVLTAVTILNITTSAKDMFSVYSLLEVEISYTFF